MLNTDTVYAAKHKIEDIRMNSRSGGVFSALTDIILDEGGVIYGCALDENFMAYHTRATTKDERDKFRGSKYIQSKMGNCYSLCENDLKSGKKVLFSGTPCQIKALSCYLDAKNTDKTNLISVDILCHSVASPKVWKKFLEWKANGRTIENVDFRDKKTFGWEDHQETLTIEEKNESSKIFSDLFYSHLMFPKSCYNCHFKTVDRFSDITLGDYWHIDELDRDFNDNNGVSLVMINTEKGESLFNKCKKQLTTKEFPLEKSLQPALKYNYPEPEKRSKFFRDLEKLNFDKIIKKYCERTALHIRIAELLFKIKNKVK